MKNFFSFKVIIPILFILFMCRRNKKIYLFYSIIWKFIKIQFEFLTRIVFLNKGKKCFTANFNGYLIILNTKRKTPAEIGLKFEVRNKGQILEYFQLYPGLYCKLTPNMFNGDEIIVYKNNKEIKRIKGSETLDYLSFIKTIKEI